MRSTTQLTDTAKARTFWVWGIVVALLALTPSDPAGAADGVSEARPNIILCMADDLGWGDTGYNGREVLKTPHLDAMARGGLRLNRFYAAAPVCSPTRGSALTGRHPYRYGVFFANVGHMRPEEVTLAEVLRSVGYTTGHFGKWHLGTLSKTHRSQNRGVGKVLVEHYSPPWENGFDASFSTEAKVPTFDPMIRRRDAGNRWWEPVTDPADGVPYGTPYFENGQVASENLGGDDSRLLMDRAIAFIRNAAQKRQPFLAVIWFHAPHLPVVAGPKHTKAFAELDPYTKHYFGCVMALDEQMGRLRRELRACGVAENTMLWFCSDNGPEGNQTAPGSAGGLRGRKRSLFEGGVRVPGILEWPARVKPGRVTDVPTCTSDYYPTVVDLLEIDVPQQPLPIDGVSLVPLIDGTMTRRPRPIAFETTGMCALIDNRYKLVVIESSRHQQAGRNSRRKKSGQSPPDRKRTVMLFDLLTDPGEQQDVATEHPDILETMQSQLTTWRQSCKRSQAGDDYVSKQPAASGS